MRQLFVLFIFFLFVTSLPANDCQKVRAGFDIGSGTTKVKVAKVDLCTKKVIEQLFYEDRPIPFKESISANSGELSLKVMDDAEAVFSDLKKKITSFHPDETLLVATSALRDAKNGVAFIERIKTNLGLEIKLITQDREAEIGYLAASAAAGVENPAVWDIGGGSMQISYTKNKEKALYQGQFASVSFKNKIIDDIKVANSKVVSTPNPLNGDEQKKALKMAEAFARKDVKREFLLGLKGKKILGIGGVFYGSLKGQLASDTVTEAKLTETLKKQVGKSDADLNTPYAATEVTNLLLVLGFMKALTVKEIQILKINLTDGLLLIEKI